MIPYVRIYELGIINYLKYEILPVEFTEREENVPLLFDVKKGGYVAQSEMDPLPASNGRGWAFFDEDIVGGKTVVNTTAEQSAAVSVTGASSYTINYRDGVILNPNTVPTSVSYNWHYVSVVAGWPGTSPPPLPVVAVDVDQNVRSGFQLGGGSRDVLDCAVYIFATDESEKRDLTGIIHDGLFGRSLTIKNWQDGSYLKSIEGTFNSGFSPAPLSDVSSAAFLDVVSYLNGPRIDWSEINRHRSRITFRLEVFRD